MCKQIWLITQAQIHAGDIDGALLGVDPEQIADDQIFGLLGGVRLRIEGARGMADIIAESATRRFCRALQARWPWAAYFLRVNPLHADSPQGQIVDLSVFMSLILVQLDHLSYAETPAGIGLRYDAIQFNEHFFEWQRRAAQLATAVDMPPTAISRRAALISRAVASFFEAGRALHQPTKRNRKKRK